VCLPQSHQAINLPSLLLPAGEKVSAQQTDEGSSSLFFLTSLKRKRGYLCERVRNSSLALRARSALLPLPRLLHRCCDRRNQPFPHRKQILNPNPITPKRLTPVAPVHRPIQPRMSLGQVRRHRQRVIQIRKRRIGARLACIKPTLSRGLNLRAVGLRAKGSCRRRINRPRRSRVRIRRDSRSWYEFEPSLRLEVIPSDADVVGVQYLLLAIVPAVYLFDGIIGASRWRTVMLRDEQHRRQ